MLRFVELDDVHLVFLFGFSSWILKFNDSIVLGFVEFDNVHFVFLFDFKLVLVTFETFRMYLD